CARSGTRRSVRCRTTACSILGASRRPCLRRGGDCCAAHAECATLRGHEDVRMSERVGRSQPIPPRPPARAPTLPALPRAPPSASPAGASATPLAPPKPAPPKIPTIAWSEAPPPMPPRTFSTEPPPPASDVAVPPPAKAPAFDPHMEARVEALYRTEEI